jgi:ketosteroid isomerase-like protein
MRHCLWLLIVMTGFVSACGSSTNVQQERDKLLAVDREWSQTTKDIDKFVSYYASDGSVYPQAMPIATGSAAIRDTMTKIASMPGFSLQWTSVKADVSASGDLGYTSGTYEMSADSAAGTPMIEKGKYVTIWKKQPDGQWKAAEDIFNADAPPPPPAPVVAPGRRAAPKKPRKRR